MMNGFSPDWLALREPFDASTRLAALAKTFTVALPRSPRLIDLGCGTGANIRYLAPLIEGDHSWLAVDGSADLLERLVPAMEGWARRHPLAVRKEGNDMVFGGGASPWRVTRRRLDLGNELDQVDLNAFDGITASALLDLVSAEWCDQLAARAAKAKATLLFALSVDGRLIFDPKDEGDEKLAQAFTRHQGRDKGFGPALGPRGAAELADRLSGHGFEVWTANSSWRVGPDDLAMHAALIDGIVQAASEAVPEEGRAFSAWRKRRLAQAKARRAEVLVGHVDLLATPAR